MATLLTQLLDRFKTVLQNQNCHYCHKALPANHTTTLAFCPNCVQQFNMRETHPLVQTSQVSTYAATLFNPTLKRLIYGYKFYNHTHHAGVLSDILGTYWEQLLSNGPVDLKADHESGQIVVVPIPAHMDHRNHLNPLAEKFASRFDYQLAPELLQWSRPVQPQHSISGKKRRLINVQGGLSVNYQDHPKPLLKARRVLILDDIHTTGATLFEATQAFQRCPIYDGTITGLTLTYLSLAFQKHIS